MFSFSAGVVDGYSAAGNNNVGFIGTVNYFHRFGLWETSGSLSYAQNVQSFLITDTTSYYYYNANVHRRFNSRVQWTLAFNGNHSGLSSDKNSTDSSMGFSTSLSYRSISATANYLSGTGNSILTAAGIIAAASDARRESGEYHHLQRQELRRRPILDSGSTPDHNRNL